MGAGRPDQMETAAKGQSTRRSLVVGGSLSTTARRAAVDIQSSKKIGRAMPLSGLTRSLRPVARESGTRLPQVVPASESTDWQVTRRSNADPAGMEDVLRLVGGSRSHGRIYR